MIEVGISAYNVLVTNVWAVDLIVCSGTAAVVVGSGRVVSFSFAGSLPRHRLKHMREMISRGIILLSIV